MRNYEVTIHHKLLNADGNLSGPGWSRHLVQQYDGTVLAKKTDYPSPFSSTRIPVSRGTSKRLVNSSHLQRKA